MGKRLDFVDIHMTTNHFTLVIDESVRNYNFFGRIEAKRRFF